MLLTVAVIFWLTAGAGTDSSSWLTEETPYGAAENYWSNTAPWCVMENILLDRKRKLKGNFRPLQFVCGRNSFCCISFPAYNLIACQSSNHKLDGRMIHAGIINCSGKLFSSEWKRFIELLLICFCSESLKHFNKHILISFYKALL